MSDKPEMRLIPTSLRCKIPHDLSYPVGAETISKALQHVPQFDQLSLTFSWWNKTDKLAKLRGADAPVEVLNACFHKPERFHSASNSDTYYCREHWNIRVYPVMSMHRHAARKAIVENGFPLLREWLSREWSQNERYGYKTLTLFFDPVEGSICAREG